MSVNISCKISRVRRFNTIIACLALACFVLAYWFFEYSEIELPMFVNILSTVLAIPVGFILVEMVNRHSIVYCPKCQGVIEKGRLIGHELPVSCPVCQVALRYE